MSCKNDYASHDEGDCAYDHRGENVKVSVLGVAVALTLGFSASCAGSSSKPLIDSQTPHRSTAAP